MRKPTGHDEQLWVRAVNAHSRLCDGPPTVGRLFASYVVWDRWLWWWERRVLGEPAINGQNIWRERPQ